MKGGEQDEHNAVPDTEPEGEAAPEDTEEEEGHSMCDHDGHIFFRDRLPDGCRTVSAGGHCGDTAADRNSGDPGSGKMTPRAATREAKKKNNIMIIIAQETEEHNMENFPVTIDVDILKCMKEVQRFEDIKKIVEDYTMKDSEKVMAIKAVCRDVDG